MKKVRVLVLLAFLSASPTIASPLDSVVRLTSHGGSGTVIWTGPGKSYILSANHMFEGKHRTMAVVIDAPHPQPTGQKAHGPSRCIGVDAGADLALVEMQAGPLPYYTPVAPAGHRPGRLMSCGYDRLQWNAQGQVRATARPAHLLSNHTDIGIYGYTHAADDPTIYCDRADGGNFSLTQELPWHGRSGGGLIDVDNGVLVGVVSGYRGSSPKTWKEVKPGACGVYGSHAAIRKFLARYAPQCLTPPAAQPQRYEAQPQLQPYLQQLQQQNEQIQRMLPQDSNLQQGRPFVEEWHETPDGRRRLPAPQQYQQPINYMTPLSNPQQKSVPYLQPYCPPGGT